MEKEAILYLQEDKTKERNQEKEAKETELKKKANAKINLKRKMIR